MALTSRFSLRAITFAVAAASAGFSMNATASMGNLGTTYGVMPVDVATAQSLSMFNDQVSATYYNPSYLTSDERGELTGGILHAEQELRSSRSDADGDIVSDSPSQHVLIGMKTNLASLTRFRHPIYLGFIAGVEKYGKEMLAFSSETSETGQYLQYGKEPLFLNIGGATPLWRGISGGFSVRVTLEAAAQLDAVSTLGGETSRERLAVNAEPSLKSILGTTINWGDTLCPDGCFLDGWESALTYRTKSSASTSVDSNIVVTQTIPEPGLSLAVATIDSFQPETIAIGTQYKGDGWRVGGSIEQQNWSELEDEFSGDTIKDQEDVSAANRIGFDDILVPRIGGEYQINRNFAVRGGLAYEESPLKTTRNPELNYLDTDKIVAGLGLSATYERTRLLAHPVRLDIGYQYQQLQDRDFTIVDFDGNEQQATADGDIHVISGSITLKF